MARITKADRELLAAEHEAEGNSFKARWIRDADDLPPYDTAALRALAKQRLKHTEELAKERATCASLIEALEDARKGIAGLIAQFDHVGCRCFFGGDDCCSFAQADTRLARIDAALKQATGKDA